MEGPEDIVADACQGEENRRPDDIGHVVIVFLIELEFEIAVLAAGRMADLYIDKLLFGAAIGAFLTKIHDEFSSGNWGSLTM